MGFCLTRKESVARAVRRVGRELSKDALHQLKRRVEGEATHELRKDLKKSRAILKLVWGGARRKPRRRQARLLRRAARRLNPLRDARAAINTLQKLCDRFETKLTPGAWRPIRDELRRKYDRENERFERRGSAKSVHRTLKRTEKGWSDLKVERKGWKAVEEGIEAGYDRGRKAWRRAIDEPTTGNFHQWRKSVKELWYQVRLLRPIHPRRMGAMERELRELGELLGDDHDLEVLRQAALRRPRRNRASEGEILEDLVERRHRELRAAARSLGARCYAEEASSFRRRLARYWRAWRN